MLGSFLIDLMIVDTFLIISSREKDRQLLNSEALNKLIRLCNNLPTVKFIIFGDKNDYQIA